MFETHHIFLISISCCMLNKSKHSIHIWCQMHEQIVKRKKEANKKHICFDESSNVLLDSFVLFHIWIGNEDGYSFLWFHLFSFVMVIRFVSLFFFCSSYTVFVYSFQLHWFFFPFLVISAPKNQNLLKFEANKNS